jgi:hypothetical protein
MKLDSVVIFVQTEPVTTALVAIVGALILFSISLSLRLNRLTRGGDGKSLESTIKTLSDRTSSLESYARKNQATIKDMEVRLARSLQGVSALRFDPFKQQGGQQSFTTAFLNEHGDGVIISGIHSRDQVRVYAKSVKAFASEHDLSEEEKTAIQHAQKNLA